MNMEYTIEQKMAMSKVLLDILSIDEHIDSRETIYFEKVKEKLKLSTQNHYDIIHLNTLKCLSTIKLMDESLKSEFVQMMKAMIIVDRYIDPDEAMSFYDICEFVHITGIGLSIE